MYAPPPPPPPLTTLGLAYTHIIQSRSPHLLLGF